MSDDNAVRSVVRLSVGDSYCRTVFIPSEEVTPDRIRNAKRKLKRDLSPVVARAKKQEGGAFRLYTTHAFTAEYDVVVISIIVRESDL